MAPVAAIVLALVGIGLGVGRAHGDEPSAASATSAILAAIESAAPVGSTSDDPRAASVGQARRLLAIGERLRARGDAGHAALADDAAKTWAEVAQTLTEADALDRKASTLATTLASASASASTASARLEAAIARRAKLRAALDAVESEQVARALGASASASAHKRTE